MELNIRAERLKKGLEIACAVICIIFIMGVCAWVKNNVNNIEIKLVDGEFIESITVLEKEFIFSYGVIDKVIVGIYFIAFLLVGVIMGSIPMIIKTFPGYYKIGNYYYSGISSLGIVPEGYILDYNGNKICRVKNPCLFSTKEKFFDALEGKLKGKYINREMGIYIVDRKIIDRCKNNKLYDEEE